MRHDCPAVPSQPDQRPTHNAAAAAVAVEIVVVVVVAAVAVAVAAAACAPAVASAQKQAAFAAEDSTASSDSPHPETSPRLRALDCDAGTLPRAAGGYRTLQPWPRPAPFQRHQVNRATRPAGVRQRPPLTASWAASFQAVPGSTTSPPGDCPLTCHPSHLSFHQRRRCRSWLGGPCRTQPRPSVDWCPRTSDCGGAGDQDRSRVQTVQDIAAVPGETHAVSRARAFRWQPQGENQNGTTESPAMATEEWRLDKPIPAPHNLAWILHCASGTVAAAATGDACVTAMISEWTAHSLVSGGEIQR
eukprot:Opistho-2@85471